MVTATPATADEAAALLAKCAADRQTVAIRGGGTKQEWGSNVEPAVLVSTLALDRLIAHRHGDLTATIEAGARLEAVNQALARHGQWLPLDPAWSDRATIGGVVATNDSGPRRHRYGAPRDLIIGVEVARVDGVRAKAGGIVVKNVAGYDLARLMTGSFGSLALITSATFKLYPIPIASRTVVVDLPSDTVASDLVMALNASQLTPTAVELQMPPLRALIRFESTAASAASQSAVAARMAVAAGAVAHVVDGEGETAEWRTHQQRPWSGDGSVVKLTLLPADLVAVLSAIRRAADGLSYEVTGRAGLGVLSVRLDGEAAVRASAIAALRQQMRQLRGGLVVLRPRDVVSPSDRSGTDLPNGVNVLNELNGAIRSAFDPSAILVNRGVE